MTRLLATVVSAVLMWAAFPPLDVGLLVFVAPAPFLWALRTTPRPGEAAWLGFVFGTLFFAAHLRWISLLGFVAWIPLSIAEGTFMLLFGLGMWGLRKLPPTKWWLATVALWSLLEFTRERWPFGGFPWGALGNGAGSLAWPRGAAQWIGTTGWSVVAIGVAAVITLIADDERVRLPARIAFGSVVVLVAAGAIFPPSADGDPFRVAIVQGGSPCPRVHCVNENELILSSHLALTAELPADEGIDLVVWPENSLGTSTYPFTNPEVFAAIVGEAQRLGAYVMVSGTRVPDDQPDRFFNANIMFGRRGDPIDPEYLKRHPVPFGEYIPFRDSLTFIPELEAVPRDMIRGTEPVVFDLTEGVLGSVISFEGAFARTVRSEVREGAELLIVLSNEGSYGRTEASDQFLGLTRMRAAETGTPIVHGAITGKSTFIDANGSIGDTTALFNPTFIIGDVHWRTAGDTFYVRYGDWLQLLAIAAGIAAVVPTGHQRKTSLATPPWAKPRATIGS